MYERADVVIEKLGNFNTHYKSEFMKKSLDERNAYKADLEQMCKRFSKEQIRSAVLLAIANHTTAGVPSIGSILKRCGEVAPLKLESSVKIIPQSLKARHTQEHVAALESFMKSPKFSEEAKAAWQEFNKMRGRHAEEELRCVNGF